MILLLLPPGCSARVDYTNVSHAEFRQEVLSEPFLSVLVVFCSEEMWDRSPAKAAPLITAVKDLMEDETYNSDLKVWKYIIPDGSYNQKTGFFDKDYLCTEFNIQWSPSLMILKNGKLVKRFDGAG